MDQAIDFSKTQWEFLAILEALGEPVPMDVVGTFVPILPGEFLELQRRAQELGWIQKMDSEVFCLSPNLPPLITNRLKEINNQRQLAKFVNKLEALNLTDKVGPSAMANLLALSGRTFDAAWIENGLADDAIKLGDLEKGIMYLSRAVNRLEPLALGRNAIIAGLFISTALKFSNLCFTLSKGWNEMTSLLESAYEAAKLLGDRRSCALIHLHMGRLFYFIQNRKKAIKVLRMGAEEVNQLGDEDIMAQSAEFMGLYYFLQGMFKEATDHFERAIQFAESQEIGHIISYFIPMFLGYSLTFLGHFQRALGCLECYWRIALTRSTKDIALTLQALLGTLLVTMRKDREGLFHLNNAHKEAINSRNIYARYLVKLGFIYKYFFEGQIIQARDLLNDAIPELANSGVVLKYGSPWFLQMLYTFEQTGCDPIPGLSFHEEMIQALNGPNVHLHGVALRLKAKMAISRGEDPNGIEADLIASEQYLKQSGDPLQIALTRLEIARLWLARGNEEKARLLAQKARYGISGDLEDIYPDDLRYLLGSDKDSFETHSSSIESLQFRFSEMMEGLFPSGDMDKILFQVVSRTNRLLKAERGALFWIGDSKLKRPILKASYNITRNDVDNYNFQYNLNLIQKSFQQGRPFLVCPQDLNGVSGRHRAILCIPLKINGQIKGVLYHDNSYFIECFNYINQPQLERFASDLSRFIEGLLDYARVKEERNRLYHEKSFQTERLNSVEFLAQSPAMTAVLAQADQIAASEASILILGETGVGKELLAHRVHRMSHRREKTFVVLDCGTISENLAESELFGYEKGAFTGAYRCKQGRLELAHNGTLFIDEIGELLLSIQTKLLRVMQDKTFNRIGGLQTLKSDFRLIAATNKNLAADVKSGRFRHDLFYRINVIALTIPPLRERPEDIVLLAKYFLALYAQKNNRPVPKLSPENIKKLTTYPWPGNVRELKNVIERSVILSIGNSLDLNLALDSSLPSGHPFADGSTLEEVQRRYIRYILEKTEGRIGGAGGAAEKLGINRCTLYSRMKRLGISLPNGVKRYR